MPDTATPIPTPTARLAELKRWASDAPAHVIAQAVLELEQSVAQLTAERDAVGERSDVPAPCSIVHEEPFDFGQCETHDETFPLGGACRFHGRGSIAEVLQEEADEQRGRAVAAEVELELLRLHGS